VSAFVGVVALGIFFNVKEYNEILNYVFVVLVICVLERG
jgi:hypothetical protein